MELNADTPSESLEIRCARCGTTNRVPRARVADGPKCGRCHQLVFPSRPVAIDTARWRAEVDDSPIPVLVDFWAPWCGPCRAVGPVLDAIAAERAGRLKIVKVNSDENPALASRFGVRAIPTMLLMRGPILVAEQAGALPKPSLDRWLDSYLGD